MNQGFVLALWKIILAPGAVAYHELVNDSVDKLFFIICTLGKQCRDGVELQISSHLARYASRLIALLAIQP